MTPKEIKNRISLIKTCLKKEKDRVTFKGEIVFFKKKSRATHNGQVRIKKLILDSEIEYDNDSIVNIPYECKGGMKIISGGPGRIPLPRHIKKHLFTVEEDGLNGNNSEILNILKPKFLDVSVVVQLSGEKLNIYYAIPHTFRDNSIASFFYSKTMDFENDELFISGIRQQLEIGGLVVNPDYVQKNIMECISNLKLLSY